ncbi:hypothetical protein QO034_15315 [Sedimentitalea sp. JM2-8]|uniref:Uncharacterized protein n=1 Tax=Sedimentitalea xiamensis TaxID=3050037 RepID=A0ABT7FH67_9RHOB|nr:hypothetical protein [Sedimentitalea xiamensis]MDK3074467.1 hypothetical protein [Sedimentitalea xiamensis]
MADMADLAAMNDDWDDRVPDGAVPAGAAGAHEPNGPEPKLEITGPAAC